MARRQGMRKLLALEEALEQTQNVINETEVVLGKIDFKDGKLSASGFKRLKQECDYIDYSEQIEIIIPKEYAEGFKNKLESMTAIELKHLKKDRKRTKAAALILLVIGALWFTVGQLFLSARFVHELTLIATWVFVWAAVEKLFFDQTRLQDKRFSLLQILAAKITVR